MYKHILVAAALDDGHDQEQSLQAAHTLVDEDGRVTILHVKRNRSRLCNGICAGRPRGQLEGIHPQPVGWLGGPVQKRGQGCWSKVIPGPP